MNNQRFAAGPAGLRVMQVGFQRVQNVNRPRFFLADLGSFCFSTPSCWKIVFNIYESLQYYVKLMAILTAPIILEEGKCTKQGELKAAILLRRSR